MKINISMSNYVEMSTYTADRYTTEPPEQDKKNATYQPPVLQPDPPIPMPCKDKCSHKVYKSADGYQDQIAIESTIARNVDVYVWSPDFSTMQYESYTSKYFSDHYVNKRFTYIGCATQSNDNVLTLCIVFNFCTITFDNFIANAIDN